tara:strand:- start:19035 stop:19796 length:762 start_codon:yes stop_codon:yes gene_type:complete
MFSRKKNPMSIYVTHGSPVVIKSVARLCSKNELHVIATCALIHGEKIYSIKNLEYLILQATESMHVQEKHRADLAQLSGDNLTSEQFIHIVNLIKQSFKINHINLRADANLIHPASVQVSTELCYLVDSIRPTSLILFSETPECIEDAQKYLNRTMTVQNHRLPPYLLSGAVATRKTLKDVIISETNKPTLIPVPNACLSFFSGRSQYRLKTPKTYPTDDTADIKFASDRTTRSSLLTQPESNTTPDDLVRPF